MTYWTPESDLNLSIDVDSSDLESEIRSQFYKGVFGLIRAVMATFGTAMTLLKSIGRHLEIMTCGTTELYLSLIAEIQTLNLIIERLSQLGQMLMVFPLAGVKASEIQVRACGWRCGRLDAEFDYSTGMSYWSDQS